MGASIVKALKLLVGTKRKPSFWLHTEEITTVYGSPHPLSVHNLCLKYDLYLKFELLGSLVPGITKWGHILKIYEPEKPTLLHQVCKLMATHLNTVAQSATNVSLAAQVMNHIVAVSIYT
jgi:hypothetical protein